MSKTILPLKGEVKGASVEKRKHILCADDHEDTRTVMSLLLEMEGYQVTTTGCVTDALSLTKRGGFDLFILDGIYPDGFGLDLCKQIRTFDARTPIFFLSACAYQSDIDRGLESGAQAYLTKPFDFDVLEQTIEQFVL